MDTNAITNRRRFLHRLSTAAAIALGWMQPLVALAAGWNKPALKPATSTVPSPRAVSRMRRLPRHHHQAPEIAENGAQVPVDLEQHPRHRRHPHLPTRTQPYVGLFEFKNGAELFISTRIKMATFNAVCGGGASAISREHA